MFRLDRTTKRIFISSAACYLVAVAVLLVSVAFAGSSSSMSRSKVSRLPTAPFSIDAGLTSVWTGKELIVSGQTGAAPDRSLLNAVDVAAAYNPATKTWRRLADPPKTENYCRRSAVWTGEEMLVWGCSQLAYNPQTDTWRRLQPAPTRHGIAVWTGKELIGWGGGCCGDADAGGPAQNPPTETWRKVSSSPLAASQDPAGAWAG